MRQIEHFISYANICIYISYCYCIKKIVITFYHKKKVFFFIIHRCVLHYMNFLKQKLYLYNHFVSTFEQLSVIFTLQSYSLFLYFINKKRDKVGCHQIVEQISLFNTNSNKVHNTWTWWVHVYLASLLSETKSLPKEQGRPYAIGRGCNGLGPLPVGGKFLFYGGVYIEIFCLLGVYIATFINVFGPFGGVYDEGLSWSLLIFLALLARFSTCIVV